MTDASKLENWCRDKKIISKADLMLYGAQNYYLRAWRTMCDWASPLNPGPKARKLTKEECAARGLTGRMAYYEMLDTPLPVVFTEKEQGQLAFI